MNDMDFEHTGLPTKDKISKTVRNSNCILPYIHDLTAIVNLLGLNIIISATLE